MTNNQWDDDKLENLLHSLPKIEDNRSKEQILERLKQDQRLNTPKKANPKKWMPFIVAAAALLLVSLIVPSMLYNNDGAMEDTEAPTLFSIEKSSDPAIESEASEESTDAFDTSDAKESASTMHASVESHVVLADELHNTRAFQIGLVESANVVPITFLLPESVIESDFPEGDPTTVELYNKYAAQFPEEELGFDNYHPYKGKLYEENGILYHQLPSGHSYDLSSATNEIYFHTMRDTFSVFVKLQLVDGNGNPTTFASIGKSDPFELKKTFPYYKYTMPSGKVYLAPYSSLNTTDTVVKALTEMKEVNGEIVESLILEQIDYDVRMEDEIAVITFKEQLDVNAFDQNTLSQMIEGFMLTAKEFGKQVRLENVVQESFSKYDLTKALPMPIGSNPTWFTP